MSVLLEGAMNQTKVLILGELKSLKNVQTKLDLDLVNLRKQAIDENKAIKMSLM